MLRKRSTSWSPRELLAKFFDRADFLVGKGVRYAAAFLIGVTTVVIIIAIVSMTRLKSSGNYATVPPTFATTQSSDEGISTTFVKRTTTTESKINESSPSSSKNTLTTKTSRRASTIASTTIYASTTTLTNSPSTRSSTSASIPTTAKSTTNTTKPVPTTKPPGSLDIHCAFAADAENFKETQTHEIDRQKKLIKDLGKKVIDTNSNSSAGLWVYGTVSKAKKFGDVFDDMVADFSKFCMKAEDIVAFGDYRSPPGGENVIDHINNATDKNNAANCLLFLTGSKEEKPVWKIDPVYNYTRIVIISLQGADFTNNVDITRGVSRNLDLEHFNDSDIQDVYDEIMRGFKRSWTYMYLNEDTEYQYV